MRIFLDPGHGGRDPGACHKQLKEKDLTLAIALRIRDQLTQHKDIMIKLSRHVDETCSLSDRVLLAERFKADFYLSIHINAGGGTGFESYRYLNTSKKTGDYHQFIHQTICQSLDVTDRGMKKGDFYVLRKTSMPALLTESLFIDHPLDYVALSKPSMIEKIVAAHVKAIICVKNTLPKPNSVVCGSFKNIILANKRQAELSVHEFDVDVIKVNVNGAPFYRVIVHDDQVTPNVEARLYALGYNTFKMS